MLFFNTAKEQFFKPGYGKSICLQQRLHMIQLSGDGRLVKMVGMPLCGVRFQTYLCTAVNWYDAHAELSAETANVTRTSYDALNFVHVMRSAVDRNLKTAYQRCLKKTV